MRGPQSAVAGGKLAEAFRRQLGPLRHFNRDCFDHQGPLRQQKGIALAVSGFKLVTHRFQPGKADQQGMVGALVTQMDLLRHLQAFRRDALA